MTIRPLDLGVLALATYRLARLAGWDDISRPIREALTTSDCDYADLVDLRNFAAENGGGCGFDPWTSGRPLTASEARQRAGDEYLPGRRYRDDGKLTWTEPTITPAQAKRAQLARCPWCAGFWIAAALGAAHAARPRATLRVATPLALSAAAGLIAKHLDDH